MNELNDFILVYYRKDFLSQYEINRNIYYPEKKIKPSIHFELLQFCCKRIQCVYPKCNIHIISNENLNFKLNMKNININIHVFPDLPLDHTAKFYIYGLLDVPAMYIDNDILIVKKFSCDHLNLKSDINLYKIDKKEFSYKNEIFVHYNAAVIYVKNPSSSIQKEIKEIHNNIFPKETNDEFALSYYIKKKNIKVSLFGEIGKGRLELKNRSELFDYQSIHYSFPKNLFKNEFYFLKNRFLM